LDWESMMENLIDPELYNCTTGSGILVSWVATKLAASSNTPAGSILNKGNFRTTLALALAGRSVQGPKPN